MTVPVTVTRGSGDPMGDLLATIGAAGALHMRYRTRPYPSPVRRDAASARAHWRSRPLAIVLRARAAPMAGPTATHRRRRHECQPPGTTRSAPHALTNLNAPGADRSHALGCRCVRPPAHLRRCAPSAYQPIQRRGASHSVAGPAPPVQILHRARETIRRLGRPTAPSEECCTTPHSPSPWAWRDPRRSAGCHRSRHWSPCSRP